MSYIIKKTEPLVNVKLTDKGREQLSIGQLKFTNFALGDGEMVYTNDNTENLNILRPVDNQPAAQYLIASEGSNYIMPITSIVSYPMVQNASADERGFFTGSTIISGYTLCGGYQIPLENFVGGTSLTMTFDSGASISATTINPSGLTPSVGSLMLVKSPKTGFTGTILPWAIDADPIPFMWYQVVSISGDTSTGFTVEVDRELPDMMLTGSTTGATGYAYFYANNMIEDVFDEVNPSAYWSAGLLDFTDTCSNGTHDVPMWNMNVFYVSDIVGLDTIFYKGHDSIVGTNYMGLYPYLQYAANDPKQGKVGIIHYTNNTVSNYYGEGFYIDTSHPLELYLPTIMWHKKQFGGAGFGDEIGYTFTTGVSPVLKYLGTKRYYDLVDSEVTPTIVGKVFTDLKIIVIENEELITAMSLKSNRNWTLPKPILQDIDAGRCSGSGAVGIITKDEELHVTYMLIDSANGFNGVHCEDYATIGTDKATADVLFRFPNDPTDSTYSEFPYFKRRTEGLGFTADNIYIILQKTEKGSRPDATGWYYFNANAYIGSNGCIPIAIPTTNDYELFVESVIVSNISKTTYQLTYIPIGDVIVSRKKVADFGGHVLKEAASIQYIYTDTGNTLCGDYIQTGNQIFLGISGSTTTTDLVIGDILQFSYLIGTAIAATTIKLDIFVPTSVTASGDIYKISGQYYSDLPSEPDGDVYLFYNGLVLNGSNYHVEAGGAYIYRVLYNFIPTAGSRITILYLNNIGGGGDVNQDEFQPIQINDFRITLNDQTFPVQATELYDLNDFITLPANNTTGMTFGDETFLFGNISTSIKSTTYKSIMNMTVLPNRYIKSNNPTFNENIHKVAFTELDIYDDDGNVVAVGKFSQPLQRKLNSDVQIINAVIDF